MRAEPGFILRGRLLFDFVDETALSDLLEDARIKQVKGLRCLTPGLRVGLHHLSDDEFESLSIRKLSRSSPYLDKK